MLQIHGIFNLEVVTTKNFYMGTIVLNDIYSMYVASVHLSMSCRYCIAGSLAGESLANWLFSSLWRKKVWRVNRSANRLLIISTNSDGFSLANHEQFAKFAKLSCYTVV